MSAPIRRAGLALGAGFLFAAQAALAQAPAPSEETPEMFPAGPNRDEAFYACIACHNFKLVAAQGLSREKWGETLDWMVTKHNMPPLAADERGKVLDYLAEVFPPKAPSQQGGWKNPFLN
ncbi:hypothetical protein ACQKLX_11040 [Bosea sp. NPDC003192]|jgi:hypothetical protein|uniref:hypothetical protein n=1 Tax=Bosea sp. NPDC003192 TaxID=3390551 RepID=UPI003CFFAFD5